MVSELRKNEAGIGLPPYIKSRMEYLGYSPTLRELARRLNCETSTLRRNLSGQSEMGLPLAKKLTDLLDVSLDDLVENCSTLTH